MIDRDIPESTWNRHMKPYRCTYQIQRDDIGAWGIRCKNGAIQPYSIVKNHLVAILSFQTSRQQTYFLKNLQQKARCEFKITQSGENDCCIMFDAQDLKKMSYLLKCRRKRQLSAETIEKLRKNLEKARGGR